MWIRLRLDIGWYDLSVVFLGSLVQWDRRVTQQKLEHFWSEGQNNALACLSVRSGFDLLLQTLDLPEGSEILFSAITIRDMPKIAEAHGLIPVPVDLCGSDFHIDTTSLQQAATSKSKVLVVSHLFGARPEMREVLEIARELNLFVVEDCAQAWCGRHWRGNEQADASLFSFGAIKTATALGGALCRISEPKLLVRMRDIQAAQPVQSSTNYLFKCGKYAFLKTISTKIMFGGIVFLCKKLGKSVDDILGNLTRGFIGENLLDEFRKQPNAGTLKMLKHRMKTYDTQRINRRIINAKHIIKKLGLENSHPELLNNTHSFWLFPLITDRVDELVIYLREHGFDTTQRGRLKIVPPPQDRQELTCPKAIRLLDSTLLLPCYSEMSDHAINRMCELILEAASVP